MFKNLHELIAQMPDEKSCRLWLAEQRWNGKPVCPHCGFDGKIYVIEGGKKYKCGSHTCYKKFSVTVGTFLEGSNIPLNKWLMAIYICTGHKKGISSYQLGKDIGVTQKSAWFMLHRIRAIMTEKVDIPMTGIVEADETYMGRKYRSDYVGLSPEEIEYKLRTPQNKKGAVLGIVERSTGKVNIKAFSEIKQDALTDYMRDKVQEGSTLHTDESSLYRKLEYNGYERETVTHSRKEFAKTSVTGYRVHCNNVEAFWSVMKRGIHGIYHQISYKHLQQYCDEFSFRHNHRHLKDHEKFQIVFKGLIGRLPYKQLIAPKNS